MANLSLTAAVGQPVLLAVGILLLLVVSEEGTAEEPPFRSELQGLIGSRSTDPDTDTRFYGLDFVWYAERVSVQEGPYAEAAFLQRSGGLMLRFFRTLFEQGELAGNTADISGKSLLFGAGLKVAHKTLPVDGIVTIARNDPDFDGTWTPPGFGPASLFAHGEENEWTLNLGAYPMNRLRIGLLHSRSDLKSEAHGVKPPGMVNEDLIAINSRIDTYGLIAEYLLEMPKGQNLRIDASLALIHYDRESVINFGAAPIVAFESGDNLEAAAGTNFYFNHKFSVGGERNTIAALVAESYHDGMSRRCEPVPEPPTCTEFLSHHCCCLSAAA